MTRDISENENVGGACEIAQLLLKVGTNLGSFRTMKIYTLLARNTVKINWTGYLVGRSRAHFDLCSVENLCEIKRHCLGRLRPHTRIRSLVIR